jgi:nucleotide-binding universal stress UspA family protein
MPVEENQTGGAMKQLLAAVDFSKNTNAVLDQAASFAKALGVKLWIVHVASDETQAMAYESTQFPGYAPEFINMPGDVQLARNLSADEIKREHSQLLGISAKLREEGVDAQAILLKGDAAKLILEKAADLPAEIIIIGSHGHGLLHKALLGSVSEAVIRHARCNVLIVPSPVNQAF